MKECLRAGWGFNSNQELTGSRLILLTLVNARPETNTWTFPATKLMATRFQTPPPNQGAFTVGVINYAKDETIAQLLSGLDLQKFPCLGSRKEYVMGSLYGLICR